MLFARNLENKNQVNNHETRSCSDAVSTKSFLNMNKLMRIYAPDEGEKIIKFGAPIGSAIEDIPIVSLVHLHNLKSD